MHGYDHEEPAIEAAAANATANGVSIQLERINLREHLPALAPTTVANLTAPILHAVAARLRGCRVPETPRRPSICSGLLPPEVDEVAAAFAPAARGGAPP